MEEVLSPVEEQVTEAAPKKKKTLIIGTVAVFLAAAVALFLITRHQQQEEQRLAITTSGTLPIGVSIDGVDVGGMTPEAATAAVEKALEAELKRISFTLTYEDAAFPMDAGAFDMTSNLPEVVNSSMSLAREGTLPELQEELLDIEANGRAFDTVFTPDEAAVAKAVARIAGEVDAPAKNASLTLPDKNAEPVEPSMQEATASATLAGANPLFQRFVAVPHADGVAVDQEALIAALLSMAARETYENIEIPVTAVPADVTLDTLAGDIHLRAGAFTSYARSPYNRASRVENLRKACGLINGTVLQPGEEFSTNGVLGDRTYGGGWQPAPAIVRGRSEDQAGGGVCQVSTTMYLAVLKSDMEVVYRRGHSGRLSYAPAGLDATIDSGRIDFKWKNNTNAPIYVFSYLDETQKTINVEIYGAAMEYDEIQLSSKKVETIDPPGPQTYTVDNTLRPGESVAWVKRKSGSRWESYATYIKDGVEVKTEFIASTVYKAYAGETLVGPTPVSDTTSTDDGGLNIVVNQ